MEWGLAGWHASWGLGGQGQSWGFRGGRQDPSPFPQKGLSGRLHANPGSTSFSLCCVTLSEVLGLSQGLGFSFSFFFFFNYFLLEYS